MNCGNKWLAPKEKMTDVNIATEMLQDAFLDKYDMAMLISGDSDLIPPIRAIHNNFKKKRVFVAFPPERFNSAISIESKGNMIIGKKNLKSSQFEDVVISVTGYPLKKPAEWK